MIFKQLLTHFLRSLLLELFVLFRGEFQRNEKRPTVFSPMLPK